MIATDYRLYVFANLFIENHAIFIIIALVLLLHRVKKNIEKLQKIEESIYKNASLFIVTGLTKYFWF